MQKIIRHKNHNDRGVVQQKRLRSSLHHYPRRVCCDCGEFLSRQLSLRLRVDAMVVRNVGILIGEPWSTQDIAGLLCANEYQVRAAVGWLLKKGQAIEVGERLLKSEKTGGRHKASLYRIIEDDQPSDFSILNRVLLGMR